MREMVKALNPMMLVQAEAMVGGQAMKDLSQLHMLQGLEPLGSGTGIRSSGGGRIIAGCFWTGTAG
jgi:hypothetical protein